MLCPPPRNLPNAGVEPRSPALQSDSLPSEPPGKPLLEAVMGKIWAAADGMADLGFCLQLSGGWSENPPIALQAAEMAVNGIMAVASL